MTSASGIRSTHEYPVSTDTVLAFTLTTFVPLAAPAVHDVRRAPDLLDVHGRCGVAGRADVFGDGYPRDPVCGLPCGHVLHSGLHGGVHALPVPLATERAHVASSMGDTETTRTSPPPSSSLTTG